MDKQYLQDKINVLTTRYDKLNEEIKEHIILSNKLLGAIEVVNILIKELDELKKEEN
jgi:hypothetical protein